MFFKNRKAQGKTKAVPPLGVAASPGETPQVSTKTTKPVWKRRLIAAGALFVALGFAGAFHAPLLQGVGQFLQQSDPLPEGDYALLLLDFPGCARNFDALTDLAGSDHEVILLRPRFSRLMKIGLEKPWSQMEIEQLHQRGLKKTHLWDGMESRYLYQFADQFETWLDKNPEKSLVIVHGRMTGRLHSRVLSRHLSPEHRRRIFFLPIDSPEFDGNNWYRVKEGQAAFFDGVNRILFDLILNDGELPGPDWDPKGYEDSLP